MCTKLLFPDFYNAHGSRANIESFRLPIIKPSDPKVVPEKTKTDFHNFILPEN